MFERASSELAPLGDDALIRLIALRRTDALSALYDRYSRLVFSLAFHVVGDRETAEEITQDVFFRVWENAASYRSDQAKLTTWMTSITRNRAIDILRKRQVRPERDSLDWEDAGLDGHLGRSQDPEDLTDLALQQQRVRLAITALSADQREVLALAYFQGLSHSQIADRLEQPLGTVKTRLRMSMQRLREILKDEN
jgi:RNA polymerase sigma-70 factor (ECF subfamily)